MSVRGKGMVEIQTKKRGQVYSVENLHEGVDHHDVVNDRH